MRIYDSTASLTYDQLNLEYVIFVERCGECFIKYNDYKKRNACINFHPFRGIFYALQWFIDVFNLCWSLYQEKVVK